MATAQNKTKEFRFRSGLTSTYDAATRAFVLRDYVVERRLRANERRSKVLATARKANLEDANDCKSEFEFGLDRSRGEDDDVVQLPASAVQNLLGQGRVDPFRSFAKDLDQFEQSMLDYYTLGDHHLFGSISRQGFNPSRDLIVQYCIQDKACIFASVAYTASHLELQGALHPALQSSKYRALTCRGLNSRLQAEGSSPSAVLVLLVCGTICIINERTCSLGRPEDADELSKHVNGLRAILAARGGWRATSAHSAMICWLLAWVDVCTFGAASIGLTPPSQHAHASPSQFSTFQGLAISLTQLYAEELIGAYGDFYRVALARRKAPTFQQFPPHARKRSLLDLFQVGTHAHRLLTCGKASLLRPVVPLIYINIMLWNYRDCSSESLLQLFHLYDRRLQAIGISRTESLGSLVWGLITDTEARCIANPNFVELLARLIYVEARLQYSTQHILTQTLLAFFQYECPKPEPIIAWWTPDQFRDIVHNDLALS